MGAQLKAIQDKLLTNVSNGLFQEDAGFLCEQIFPTLDVVQNTGKLGKYGTGHLRLEHSLAGGRGEARRVAPTVRTTDSYQLEKHALEGLVTEDDYDNAEAPFDAEKDETLGVSELIRIGKEYAVASALTNTSILTNNETLSGTSQFSDYQNSDPLSKFKTAMAAGKANGGVIFNTVIMSWEVKNVLKYHPMILDQLGFKYNQAGLIGEAELAKALDVPKVLIAKSTYESAKEGQTSSLAPIWGKSMIFAYLPDSARPYQKSLGYLVRKKGVGSRKVYKYAINNPINSTGIQVVDYYQYLISDVNCAYLIKNAVA